MKMNNMKKYMILALIVSLVVTFKIITFFAFFNKQYDENTVPVVLEFKLVTDGSDKGNFVLGEDVLIDNKDIQKAALYRDDFGRFTIHIQMTDEGGEKLKDITQKNIGKQIAILLGGKILSAPEVRDTITDGKAVITLSEIKDKNKALEIVAGIIKQKDLMNNPKAD